MGINWTEDREEQLKRLWADGFSCREIATEMGGFGHCGDHGRSAVIGKIHRMELPTPDSKKAPKGYAVPTKAAAPKKKPGKISSLSQTPRNPSHGITEALAIAAAEPGIPELLKGEPPDGTGVKSDDLIETSCRWPRGDPRQPDFEFCGTAKLGDLPYCAKHCRIAYRPEAHY